MSRWCCAALLLWQMFACPSGANDDLSSLSTAVLTADERTAASGLLSTSARQRLKEANQRSTAAWRKCATKADWEQHRDQCLAALKTSLGEFPQSPQPPRVEITRTQEVGDVRVDSLVFESRPGWYVTANLYAPLKPPTSAPGFLLSHSHHSPKSQGELQDMGHLWAKAGCYVLVPDHLGHGERRQHPFRSAEDYPEKFQVGRQDYHFRYNTAAQLYLVGESLMGWLAWDLMRGVDVLLKQPGIDPERIILLGGVAGGGDPAGVTAALDSRIKAVCPMNFGGPQPETKFPLPEDAEETFNYAGSGGWESTRNLARSAAGGFLPWVIVGSVAPRGLIHGHEFAWDEARDPVWKRYERIFRWYDAPEKLGVAHGHGAVTQSEQLASHCGNIGTLHRQAMHSYFEKWFAIKATEAPVARFTADQLSCLNTEKGVKFKSTPLHEMTWNIASVRCDRMLKQLTTTKDGAKIGLRRHWQSLLGNIEPATAVVESRGTREVKVTADTAAKVRSYLLRDGEIPISVLFISSTKATENQATLVIFARQGKEVWLKKRAALLAQLLPTHHVCLVDLRGCGETKAGSDRGRRSESTSLWASELMLGETVIGSQLKDLRTTLAWLRKQPGVNGDKLIVYGDSLAEVNPPEANLRRPLELEQPKLGEPMGAIVGLLAGLYEDKLAGVIARGGIVQYRLLLESPFIHIAHDAIVPGAAAAGDLPVVMQHCSGPLLLADLVDGLNRAALPGDQSSAFTEGTQPPKSTIKLTAKDEDIVKWITALK